MQRSLFMNKRAYIFCLVAAVIVATFVIGYNLSLIHIQMCIRDRAGIQQEIRKREHYEKPSVKRKKKSEAARKRKYN